MSESFERGHEEQTEPGVAPKAMKIVLLALHGDMPGARRLLDNLYPQALVEEIPRREVEEGSHARRLRRLRNRRPNLFAVATEQLAWQRGQNQLLLFGALAGAERTVIFDKYGALREETRARTLASAPSRLAHEAALSARAILRARSRLAELERAVQRVDWLQRRRVSATADAPAIVYLRSTPGAGTQAGGASSHIKGFTSAALSKGARLRLISNDRIAGLDGASIPVKILEPVPLGTTRVAFDLYNNELFTRGVLNELEELQPDFIYQRYSRFSLVGVEASLRSARPLFLEYNGSEVWVGRYWDRIGMLGLLARFERLNLLASARVFVVSEVEKRNLLRAGVPDEKIVVNPNGVDAERFRPGAGGLGERRRLCIEDDETLVGFVSTFGPWHGALVLARAIARMPASSRLRFLLVGTGSLREEAERLIREAGAAGRVIFTGAVEHQRVPALLDACDVLVSPHVQLEDGSEFFGSPTKLFEYMAMGKAIVASRLGQIAEVLRDEETALLVEPGDAQALSDAILRLKRSKELRERLGRAARLEAVAHHTWAHNAGRVLDAYHDWLGEGGRTS